MVRPGNELAIRSQVAILLYRCENRNQMPYNLLSDLARRYRKLYPNLKFRIVNANLDDAFATTHLREMDGTFVITFDRKLCVNVKAFLLAHELAHAISWNMDDLEHGDGFWSCYRRTYAIYADFVAK
jgi:hypothetical protein